MNRPILHELGFLAIFFGLGWLAWLFPSFLLLGLLVLYAGWWVVRR